MTLNAYLTEDLLDRRIGVGAYDLADLAQKWLFRDSKHDPK